MRDRLWMKGLVLGIIFLFVGGNFLLTINANAETPPELEWNETYGEQKQDIGYSVKQTSDGGFIIAGIKDSWMDENYSVYEDRINENSDGLPSTTRDVSTSERFASAPLMKVIITKPLENTLYIRDKPRMNLSKNTFIYGPITITANVTSNLRITRVKFYIDGRLKKIDIAAPYTYVWNPIIQFKGLSLKHTIKVIAYDKNGTSASDELNVTKWRFHTLPLMIANVAGAGAILSYFKHSSSFIKHTTVRGLFFNVQNTMFTTSFYALHIHYRTTGLFRHARGIIDFKECTGGTIIGPILSQQIGVLPNIMYGTFTFLGDIHYNRSGFGLGFTSTVPTT